MPEVQARPKIRFLRVSEVSAITSYSVPSIRRLSASGAFPRARKIGQRRRAWLESEIYRWMREKALGGSAS